MVGGYLPALHEESPPETVLQEFYAWGSNDSCTFTFSIPLGGIEYSTKGRLQTSGFGHPQDTDTPPVFNVGPPTPAVEIPSYFIVAINSYRTSIYDIRLAIDILVVYLLSKL